MFKINILKSERDTIPLKAYTRYHYLYAMCITIEITVTNEDA